MPIRIAGLLCGGVLLLSGSAPALAAAPPLRVTFRAEGVAHTLVAQRAVTLADAPIVKDGDPQHSCPGQSALGALQAATQGNWEGSWSEGLGYFVSAIEGEKAAGSDFFSFWLNHKLATSGLCQTDLHAGDRVLMFVDHCVYDAATQGCKNKPVTPLGIRVASSVRRGHFLTVRVVDYSADGRAHVQRGATVFANGHRLGRRTDSRGRLRVQATRPGRVSFYAVMSGRAKSETAVTHVRRR